MAQAVDRPCAMVRDGARWCAMVREGIVQGTYTAAVRITEQEIAEALSVSRTPVREALRRLQAEGFLKVLPNVGAVVTPWTDTDTRNVFELRALLEPYGAARACEQITPVGLATLRRLAEEQYHESATRGEGHIERIGRLNSAFHRALQDFSGNARLVALLPALLEAPMMLKTLRSISRSTWCAALRTTSSLLAPWKRTTRNGQSLSCGLTSWPHTRRCAARWIRSIHRSKCQRSGGCAASVAIL